MSTVAYGSGNHDRNHHNHTNPVVIENTTVINKTIKKTVTETSGAALGIASDHQFDMGTLDLQWSLSGAAFDKAKALSFGLARKPCGNCSLYSGSVGIETINGKEKTSVSGSISGKF